MYFKITLWMITYRTYLRGFCSYHNMSTVTHSHTLTSLFSNTCAVSIFLRSARYLSSWCFKLIGISSSVHNSTYTLLSYPCCSSFTFSLHFGQMPLNEISQSTNFIYGISYKIFLNGISPTCHLSSLLGLVLNKDCIPLSSCYQ